MAWDVWDEIERMQEEIERMTAGLFGRGTGRKLLGGPRRGGLLPAKYFRTPLCDVKESDDKVMAAFELPGIDKKDIELNITDDRIEVRAEKKEEQEIKGKDEYRYFASTGSFYRNIPLPAEVDADKATAVFKNGVLKIEAPKKDGSKKKKRIEIK